MPTSRHHTSIQNIIKRYSQDKMTGRGQSYRSRNAAVDSIASIINELSSQAPALPSQHPLIASIPIGFISRAIPVSFSALSYLVTSLTNLLLPVMTRIQTLGEKLLTACVLLSIIQASIALYQYRYDSRGQLLYPDGLTLGVEQYLESETDGTNTESTKQFNTGITMTQRLISKTFFQRSTRSLSKQCLGSHKAYNSCNQKGALALLISNPTN